MERFGIKPMSTHPDGIVHQPLYNSIGMDNINNINAEDKSNIHITKRMSRAFQTQNRQSKIQTPWSSVKLMN